MLVEVRQGVRGEHQDFEKTDSSISFNQLWVLTFPPVSTKIQQNLKQIRRKKVAYFVSPWETGKQNIQLKKHAPLCQPKPQ
jgi:hypothetical protein